MTRSRSIPSDRRSSPNFRKAIIPSRDGGKDGGLHGGGPTKFTVLSPILGTSLLISRLGARACLAARAAGQRVEGALRQVVAARRRVRPRDRAGMFDLIAAADGY